jgi:hydroxylamine reductase
MDQSDASPAPTTMSPAVVKVLVDDFGVAGINNAEDDVQMFMTS